MIYDVCYRVLHAAAHMLGAITHKIYFMYFIRYFLHMRYILHIRHNYRVLHAAAHMLGAINGCLASLSLCVMCKICLMCKTYLMRYMKYV